MAVVIDGEPHIARLTLGALAELEEVLAVSSLLALVERFESGNFTSADVIALLVAGLRSGGSDIDADTLGQAQIEGGPMAGAKAAADLLARAFVAPQ